jgi:hypothetical protein
MSSWQKDTADDNKDDGARALPDVFAARGSKSHLKVGVNGGTCKAICLSQLQSTGACLAQVK